jgi:hypothetical protein
MLLEKAHFTQVKGTMDDGSESDQSGCLHVRSTRLQFAHHMALLGKAECGITEDRITGNPYRFTKIYPIK